MKYRYLLTVFALSLLLLLPGTKATAQVIYGAPITLAPTPLQNIHPPGWHPPRFKGFVDLHTHPLSYLGFGGKLLWGGLDVGSLLPADSLCNHYVVAKSIQQALATDNSVRGGHDFLKTDKTCGDELRKIFFGKFESVNNAASVKEEARGFPTDYTKPSNDGQDFVDWPTWDDIDHQKMWVDSIHRAYVGGLRVMVALAVNNKTLADTVRGTGDTLPDNDKDSAIVQINETKNFVNRHKDFMEIAYSSRDLERIVKSNKLAVILGIEVDNMGDINTLHPISGSQVLAVIRDLHIRGIRYIFPIHVLDNPLGGTAVYQPIFNLSNYFETGHYWNLGCSQPADKVSYQYSTSSDFWQQLDQQLAMNALSLVKLGKLPPSTPNPPSCPPGTGHVNQLGLTRLGEIAIKYMMMLGMLIDIDHMSQKAANQALDIAEAVPGGGYPLFSGHNGLREGDIGHGTGSEINRTPLQYKRIAKLHGMAGVGTAELSADQFLKLYNAVVHASDGAPAAFGTDTDGVVKGMPTRPGSHVVYNTSFPMSRMGSRQWDYNRDGVAHYGMIADYIKDMESLSGASGLINDYLMNGADYFEDSWIKAEEQSKKVKHP